MINPFNETTSWTYLNNDWLETQTLANGAVTTYTHNPLGQLTRLLNQVSGNTISDFSSISYDGVGNRTSITASIPGATALSGVTTYQYNSKNELTQESSTRNGGFTDNFDYDVGKPRPSEDSPGYYCPFQISGSSEERIKYAKGIDAIQALQGAMLLIGVNLEFLNQQLGGKLRWEGDTEGDLGFPSST